MCKTLAENELIQFCVIHAIQKSSHNSHATARYQMIEMWTDYELLAVYTKLKYTKLDYILCLCFCFTSSS